MFDDVLFLLNLASVYFNSSRITPILDSLFALRHEIKSFFTNSRQPGVRNDKWVKYFFKLSLYKCYKVLDLLCFLGVSLAHMVLYYITLCM